MGKEKSGGNCKWIQQNPDESCTTLFNDATFQSIDQVDSIAFRTALQNSQNNTNTVDDDAIVGSCSSGGFCAQDAYALTPFCACMNSNLTASGLIPPECDRCCAGNPLAYKPTSMRDMGNGPPSDPNDPHSPPTNPVRTCSASVNVCNTFLDTVGNNNVVSDVTQTCGTFAASQAALTVSQLVDSMSKTEQIQMTLLYVLISLVVVILVAQLSIMLAGGSRAPSTRAAKAAQ